MRFVRVVVLLMLAWVSSPASATAQLPTPARVRPVAPAGRDTIRARGDTLRPKPDSMSAKDSLAKANFAAPDTVMQRLMNLPGYNVTRYQGESILFDAMSRAIQLTNRAIVEKDSQLVKSDTISYSGSGNQIRVGSAKGKQNVMVTPGQAPIFTTGEGTYNLATRRLAGAGLSTSIDQAGQTLHITGDRYAIKAAKDSIKGANDANYYFTNGTVTACDDSIPDYYFKSNEIKRTGSFVVARPAVLYIGDVPVMWLPFLFQDIRSGRRSGIIAPNVGVSDIIRNSPSYRRNVEGIGYYFAISDFLDSQVSLDWRSGAGETNTGDIGGYMRYNGEFHYRWLDRFLSGGLAVSHTATQGQTNDAYSWQHQQSFTRNSSLTTQFNYATSTRLQALTTTNPYSQLATISSQANYQHKFGPAQLSLGATQRQYPGRTQFDRGFPTLSITTSPLNLGSALTWTPNFSYSATQSKGIDNPTPLSLLLRPGTTPAGIDSIFADTLKRNSSTRELRFDTPIVIFGYNLGNSFNLSSALNDFPEREIVTDVITGVQTERIYAQTFHDYFDWTPQFSLPAMARNNFNLTPSFTIAKVDGGALMIRNERTRGQWVSQSFRPSFGLSAAPTLFGLFRGIGPYQRFRHSLSPTVTYSYAPPGNVSNAYLAAVGRTKYSTTTGDTTGYLGALAQNSISLGLSTNIEGKLKSPNDSNPEAGEKVKLLSLNFTSLNYDFERARYTGKAIRGLTTSQFGYTVRSDLLPGFDVGVDYSLFDAPTVSDSAKFNPFRERVTAAFSFSNGSNPFAIFTRIFGRAVPESSPGSGRNTPPPDNRYATQIASQPVAGRASRSASFLPEVPAGWQASFTFTSTRQRPPSGSQLNVVAVDPALQCALLNTPVLRIQYDRCVAEAKLNPSPLPPPGSGLPGATFYITPPVTSLGSNVSLNLTEHWAASWQTQYDFEGHDFASQIVSLQRDLHDWRAIFAFTQSPNGSFAFNFLISLKAEPQLKFDYHKSTYRNEGLTP
ncbi:MAG: putative LPS assembly protein LptD [bacterium]